MRVAVLHSLFTRLLHPAILHRRGAWLVLTNPLPDKVLANQHPSHTLFLSYLNMLRAGLCGLSVLSVGLVLTATETLADLNPRNDGLIPRTSITTCSGTACSTTVASCTGTACPATSIVTTGTAVLSYFRPGETRMPEEWHRLTMYFDARRSVHYQS